MTAIPRPRIVPAPPLLPGRIRAWVARRLDRFAWQRLARSGKLAAYAAAAANEEATLRALRETTQVLQPVLPRASTVYGPRSHPVDDDMTMRLLADLAGEDSSD